MKNYLRILSAILLFGALLAPGTMLAATKAKFYYSGWLPYWKQQAGAQDTALNLDKLHEISPFSYEVKSDGTLVDKLKINEGFWPAWLSAARDMKIKIIPTIAWFDGQGLHNLLSNKKKRIAHEDAIAKLVKTQNFDGIDIDYEAKRAETKEYFSTFLYGLAIRLHPMGKTLSCTIETRIPPTSRYSYTGTPDDYLYSNDYVQINKYCDQVRIMTYDQGIIDVDLDVTKGGDKLYAPVSDPDWVKKVLTEATKTINPKKIMLGIPTYGYEYQVTAQNGIITYERLRSHTFVQAMARATSTGSVPTRNNAGELSFTYATSSYVYGVSPNLTWTLGSALNAVLANAKTASSTIRFVSFADAKSAEGLIAVAKKFGLRGVVFFKLDGDQDQNVWSVMK